MEEEGMELEDIKGKGPAIITVDDQNRNNSNNAGAAAATGVGAFCSCCLISVGITFGLPLIVAGGYFIGSLGFYIPTFYNAGIGMLVVGILLIAAAIAAIVFTVFCAVKASESNTTTAVHPANVTVMNQQGAGMQPQQQPMYYPQQPMQPMGQPLQQPMQPMGQQPPGYYQQQPLQVGQLPQQQVGYSQQHPGQVGQPAQPSNEPKQEEQVKMDAMPGIAEPPPEYVEADVSLTSAKN